MRIKYILLVIVSIMLLFLLVQKADGADRPSSNNLKTVVSNSQLVQPANISWRPSIFGEYDIAIELSSSMTKNRSSHFVSGQSSVAQKIGIMQRFEEIMSQFQEILDLIPLKNIEIGAYKIDFIISRNKIVINIRF